MYMILFIQEIKNNSFHPLFLITITSLLSRILAILITFWAWKLHTPMMDYSYVNQNMPMVFLIERVFLRISRSTHLFTSINLHHKRFNISRHHLVSLTCGCTSISQYHSMRAFIYGESSQQISLRTNSSAFSSH